MRGEQKGGRGGDGGEKRRERLPTNFSILKNTHWYSWFSSFID